MKKIPYTFPSLLMETASHVAQIAHGYFRHIAKIHAAFHSSPFYRTWHLVHWL